ncbi:MAG TPA: hypothetical protein VLN44_00555 [Pyrinomonadaceae bacterium]|nr:hypothetical protein [Pyrinomonadaceae bacterium]
MPGDVIKISGVPVAAKKFFYVGGEVGAPGEKTFRERMTLPTSPSKLHGTTQHEQ